MVVMIIKKGETKNLKSKIKNNLFYFSLSFLFTVFPSNVLIMRKTILSLALTIYFTINRYLFYIGQKNPEFSQYIVTHGMLWVSVLTVKATDDLQLQCLFKKKMFFIVKNFKHKNTESSISFRILIDVFSWGENYVEKSREYNERGSRVEVG